MDAVDVVLLGVSENLLVVSRKEKRLVFDQRPAQCEAELPLPKIGRARDALVLGGCGKRAVFAEEMDGPVQLVGAGLGDGIDKAPAGPAKFGVGPLGNHHDFLDRVHVKGEGRALPPALFPEEGIVEIRAIDRDVVVNAALPGNGQFIPIRPLHDAHARGQQGEVEDIAPIVGQVSHGFFGQARRRLALRDVHRGPHRFNEGLFHDHRFDVLTPLQSHFDVQFHGLANPNLDARLPHVRLVLLPAL